MPYQQQNFQQPMSELANNVAMQHGVPQQSYGYEAHGVPQQSYGYEAHGGLQQSYGYEAHGGNAQYELPIRNG
jgi:hypothetical protein